MKRRYTQRQGGRPYEEGGRSHQPTRGRASNPGRLIVTQCPTHCSREMVIRDPGGRLIVAVVGFQGNTFFFIDTPSIHVLWSHGVTFL